MRFEKTKLALAMASVLAGANAYAVVNIDGNNSDAVKYASEIVLPSTGAVLTNNAGLLDINAVLNYAMAPQEVRYARLECGTPSTFNFPAVNVTAAVGSTQIVPGPINGLGTNALYFSLTNTDTALGSPATSSVAVTLGNPTLLAKGNVNCTFSLYDLPSNAANGGTTGLIPGVGASDVYITFTPGFFLEVFDSNTNIADVNADPSFTEFTNDSVSNTQALIGVLRSGIYDGVLRLDGNQVNVNDLLAGGTELVINGNYGAAPLTGTPVALYTQLGSAPTFCSGTMTDGVLDALRTSATFAYPSASAPSGAYEAYSALCYTVDGATQIAESVYDGDFNPVSNTGYSVPGAITNGPTVGNIIRNGTELRAPLVQRPEGWTGRMVLMNNGNLPRDYSINIVDEEGNPAVPGVVSGTIAANSIKVLNIVDIIAGFATNPPARAGLVAFVGAPRSEIEGLIQLINQAGGGVSNYIMVSPTTTSKWSK